MTLVDLIPLLVAALAGGGVSAVVTKAMELRANRSVSDGDRLAKCQRQYDELMARFDQVSLRLRAVEDSTPSYLSRWIKGQDRRVIWLNDRAYMSIFAPLGLSREDVIGRTFAELLGEGSGYAATILDALDEAALRQPDKPRAAVLQLHPALPTMLVIKAATIGTDGLLRFEGTSFVSTFEADDFGPLRQHRQTVAAAMLRFNDRLDEKEGTEGHA